jgi:rod shape-determining protein MreD
MRGLGGFAFGLVVVLLLRSTALSALAARGLVLDALAFAVVLYALRNGPGWGCSFGFALGLAADLDAAHWLGRHAFGLTWIGYVVGRLSSTLVRDSPRTLFALLLAATALHQVWSAAFELSGWDAGPYLLLRTAAGTLATAAVGTALLIAMRRLLGVSPFAHAAIPSDPIR